MSAAAEQWRGDIVWFATVVCAFLGPILGCVVYGVLEGKPWLFLGVDIAGVPFAAYAFLSFVPVGLVAGHLGGRLCLALIDRGYGETIPAALMLGLVGGAASAPVLVAAPYLVTGNLPRGSVLITSMISGGMCGLLIGGYARRRMRPAVAERGH